MLKTIPSNHAPPILVLLTHSEVGKGHLVTSSDDDIDQVSSNKTNHKRHTPSLLRPLLSSYDIPWAVSFFTFYIKEIIA